MTQSTEIAQQNPHSHKKNSTNSKTWHRALFGLIFILGLSVIGLFFYINNLIKLQNNQLQQNIQKINTNQAKISDSILANLTNITQNFDAKYITIDKKISKTLQETTYLSNDWIMQKAKYYLELAVINNNWTDDVNTTKKLLKAADNTLKDIRKDEIIEVRKLIAYEKLQLNSIKKLDTIKLLAEINAINEYLKNLPIISLKKRIANDETNKDSQLNQPSTWQANLKNNLKKLNDLIIVRRNTENSTEFLSPSYLLTIRETLRLNLQQMQWAILEKNQETYNLSCKQALANITYSLEDMNPKKEAIIKKINKLQKINLNFTKIKIGKSLTELNKVIDSTENIIIKAEQHGD